MVINCKSVLKNGLKNEPSGTVRRFNRVVWTEVKLLNAGLIR